MRKIPTLFKRDPDERRGVDVVTDDGCDLERAMEEVLTLYGIDAYQLGPDGLADRGDLASDLADVARGWRLS